MFYAKDFPPPAKGANADLFWKVDSGPHLGDGGKDEDGRAGDPQHEHKQSQSTIGKLKKKVLKVVNFE